MDVAIALTVWFAALALAAWGMPLLVSRGVVRSLERDGRGVPNWRGRTVVPALGSAWLGWCIGVALLAAVWSVASGLVGEGAAYEALVPATFPVDTAPLFLVLGAFALGLMDDAYGSHAEKGLRGHLGALGQGRVTTGVLKLFGIAALAAVQCSSLAIEGSATLLGIGAVWLAATVAVAGSANLVNLADLRPGRALKVYGLLALVPIGAVAFDLGDYWTLGQTASAKTAIAIILLGPLFAAWGPDVRERAMLGDAGSNAAGALVGYAIALTVPAVALYVIAALLVVLNLLAERFSLSEAIERNAALKWLDGLGRPKEAE